MIYMIAKVLKVLNSESEPGQIALALCFSMIAGFTPFFSLHNVLILLLVLLLRVNLTGFIVGWLFFTAVAYLLDPLFHQIGLALLTASFLEGMWTGLYNISVFRLEKFNYSIMMGSLVFSLVLFIPLFFSIKAAVVRYREHVLTWVKKTRVVEALQATRLYRIYTAMS